MSALSAITAMVDCQRRDDLADVRFLVAETARSVQLGQLRLILFGISSSVEMEPAWQ